MKKLKTEYLLSLYLLGLTIINCYSQSHLQIEGNTALENFRPNVVAPETASLGMYGTIPVSLHTGTPNISIPIYNISERGINIPISLNYHTGAVKPDLHPGPTGLGWSLLAGGAITRQYNQYLDETDNSSNSTTHVNPYRLGYYRLVSNDKYDKLLSSPNQPWRSDHWFSKISVENYNYLIQSGPTETWGKDIGELQYVPHLDFAPDRFSFNFLGYSGEFFLNPDGEWIVKSDHNFKVVFDGDTDIVKHDKLREPIKSVYEHNSNTPNDGFFLNFTLVAEDGTKYKFGGVNATEYTTDFRTLDRDAVYATTWKLHQIITPQNEVVNFEYEPWKFVCSLQRNFYSNLTTKEDPNKAFQPSFSVGCEHSSSSLTTSALPSGSLIFPVYLKRIKTKTMEVNFEYSKSEEMEYRKEDLTLFPNRGDIESHPWLGGNFDVEGKLEWRKLDRLVVKKKDEDNFYKKIDFNYTNQNDERLKLGSIDELYFNADEVKSYTFSYNPNEMPRYLHTHKDHWGFYNGTENYPPPYYPYTNSNEFIYNYINHARVTDKTEEGKYYKYNILEKITYPTGGYTEFEFEPHEYGKTVNSNITSVIEVPNKRAGGLRVKKVKSYSTGGLPVLTKEYIYTRNYSANGLKSSGVLNGVPRYFWDISTNDGAGDPFYYSSFNSNSQVISPLDPDANHIMYSEVTEKIKGNGYTVHKFTTFDKDEYGNSHLNTDAISGFGFVGEDKNGFSAVESRDLERGKPTSIQTYNDKGKKVKEIYYHYQKNDEGNYVPTIKRFEHKVCGTFTDVAYIYALRRYFYNYNLVQKEEIVYDVNGENPITTTVDYSYTSADKTTFTGQKNINLLTQKTSLNSKEEEQTTTYKYPFDYIENPNSEELDAATAQKMVDDNLVSSVVKKVIKKDNKAIITQVTNYHDWDSSPTEKLILPKAIKSSKGNYPLEEDVRVHSYYANGNLKEVSFKNGKRYVYIWGYNQEYLIAKIENASYVDIQSYVDSLVLFSNQDIDDNSENILRDELNKLRTSISSSNKNSLITTYTYDPLIGVKSITDTRGKTLYYKYDNSNRLKYVVDDEGNVLSKNEYHYKNQN